MKTAQPGAGHSTFIIVSAMFTAIFNTMFTTLSATGCRGAKTP
jgi:hypothetical protein